MATGPSLGTRIRRARERKRWTQRQLAERLRVSVRTVNDWENDRTSPRSSIGALEHELCISLADPGPGLPDIVAENAGDDRVMTIWRMANTTERERLDMIAILVGRAPRGERGAGLAPPAPRQHPQARRR